MKAEIKPMFIVNEDAMKILMKELGTVDTFRFMNQFSTGIGNYTEERRNMVDSMTLEDIVSGTDEMKRSYG